MRLSSIALILLLLGVAAGTAFADKEEPNEKPWGYGLPPMLSTFPEQEPNDICPGQAMSCGDVIEPGNIVLGGDFDWYRFYAEAGNWLTIGTDSYQGSATDTYLELYFECGTTMLAYNDDGGPGAFSLISNYTAPYTGYYDVKCRGYNSNYSGDYILFVTCVVPPPPDPNDTCNPDIFIAHCTAGTLEGNLTYDANHYTVPSGGCTGFTANGKDVAYKLDLQAGDIVDLSYRQASYDASIYIITDCANPSTTCVIGADDTATGGTETIHWVVATTGTYWLILDTYGTNTGGAWTLTYGMTCVGACCLDNGECTVTYQADCTGFWYEGQDCSEPCPVPAEDKSWGDIKGQYR